MSSNIGNPSSRTLFTRFYLLLLLLFVIFYYQFNDLLLLCHQISVIHLAEHYSLDYIDYYYYIYVHQIE